jgi:hypothetical protein
VADTCEYGNEPSGYIEAGNFCTSRTTSYCIFEESSFIGYDYGPNEGLPTGWGLSTCGLKTLICMKL